MKYIISVFLSLSFLSVWAQSENETEFHSSWAFYISTGYYFNNNQKVHDFLKENDMGQLGNDTYYTSIGLVKELKKSSHLILKGIILEDKLIKSNTNSNTQLEGWGLGIDFNYNLLSNQHKNFLFASCGTGFNKRKIDLPIGIDGNLNGRNTFRTKGLFHSELGICYEHKFVIGWFNICAGIKALYHIPLGNKHWYNANNDMVKNLPNADSNSFNLGITSRIAINWDKFQR